MNKKILKQIYDYAYKVFFGQDKEDVNYRIAYGSNGAEQKVLKYIENMIYDDDNEELYTEWY